jgi:hypothetical protein
MGTQDCEAIEKIRGLRPGSVETIKQERAIERYAGRVSQKKEE